MATYNKIRTERMKAKSNAELKQIADSGSLSAAAAAHEMRRRNNG